MTHYEVLGIDRRASGREIRGAYVRLARRYHPDLLAGRSDADVAAGERRMRQINEAWAELGDPVRRARYDEGLAERRFEHRPPPRQTWVPYDEGPPDIDRLPPDPPGRGMPRLLAMGPPLALLFCIAWFAIGIAIDSPGVLAFAAVLLGVTLLFWLAAPLYALAKASRDS